MKHWNRNPFSGTICQGGKAHRPLWHGNGADAILDRCAALGIPVAGVFASDEFVRGQEFRGYKVKTYKEMKAELGSFVILIAFASERPEILRRFFHLAREQETYAPHLPLFGDSRVVTPGWIRENRGVLERSMRSWRMMPAGR